MRKIVLSLGALLFLWASSVCSVNGQTIPDGYYDDAAGLTGYSLKTALCSVIANGHSAQSYSSLWSFMATNDLDAYYENDGSILDIYSENPSGDDPYNFAGSSEQCGTYSAEGDCYNREHSFPKSWFGSASPMYTDIHHLYPTDGKVNGVRANYPFGEVGAATYTSSNGSMLGTAADNLGYSGTVFEPIDEFKGDLARSYFYMATRYEDVISSWSSDVLDGSSDQVYKTWYLDLMLAWHEADPVSQKEIDRNEAAYAFQGNRNPFVDHPEYVSCIWGDDCSESSDPYISSSSASLSFSYYTGPSESQYILVRAGNLTTDVTASLTGDFEFSLDNSSFQSTDLSLEATDGSISGTRVYLRLKAGLADDSYTGTLSLSTTDASTKSISLNGYVGCAYMDAPDAPVALDASSIDSSSFVAHWKAVANAATYYLDVYKEIAGGTMDMSADGSGTEADPYNITQARALSTSTTLYFVKGYIVGGRYDDFDSPSGDYGISIAADENESAVDNCLQLKLETDFRSDWGLSSNPSLLGTAIIARGYRDTYGGYDSFEGVDSIQLAGDGITLEYVDGYEQIAVTDTFALVEGLLKDSTYSYRVSVENSCGEISEYSNVMEVTTVAAPTTGVNDLEATLQLYPNPVKAVLQLSSSLGIDQLVILNAYGQVVFKQAYPGDLALQLSVASYSPGVYFLNVNSGGVCETKLFVKE